MSKTVNRLTLSDLVYIRDCINQAIPRYEKLNDKNTVSDLHVLNSKITKLIISISND